jgi:hypothetical protein
MADNLSPSSTDVTESGSLNLPEPSRPHKSLMGMRYPFTYQANMGNPNRVFFSTVFYYFINERFIAPINIKTYMIVTKLFFNYNQFTTVS